MTNNNGWQPIETAPKDGTVILTVRMNERMPPRVWRIVPAYYKTYKSGLWGEFSVWLAIDGRTLWKPDYWMPEPDMPKGI